MKALVIGATGATGQALLPLLISFGRRAPDLTDAKLRSHIIDFHQPQQWADKVQGDAVFICLGTTLKAAGSKAAQWQIDYQTALDFARAARHNGASTLVLVSAAGANARSPFFYPRMKGALEEAVTVLGYPRLRIYRPSHSPRRTAAPSSCCTRFALMPAAPNAKHYRIRVGENDRDTSLAVSQLLALKLQAHGKNVDYALPWGVGHSGDYDVDELFAWMKSVAAEK